MHQQLITCDCCKQVIPDPVGWISIRHGPFYDKWRMSIDPLTPGSLTTLTKRTTEHVCSAGCLAQRVEAIVTNYLTGVKQAKKKAAS